MGVVRQVCSLRISPELYAGLSRLAKERGTTITAQLERAVRTHLQTALTGETLPLIRPELEAILGAELQTTLGGQFREVRERLAGLMAKMAIDSGMVLYLMLRREEGGQRLYDEARAWAARHVRDRSDVESVAQEELESLRRELRAEQQARMAAEQALAEVQGALRQAERARAAAESRATRAELQVQYHEELQTWAGARDQWAQAQHEGQGVLKRRPVDQFRAEYERLHPPPRRPV